MHMYVHVVLHVHAYEARWTVKGQETVSCNERMAAIALTHIHGLLDVLSWLAPGNTDTYLLCAICKAFFKS